MEKNALLKVRKGRSNIYQIIRLQDTINKYNLNKGHTLAVFVDFERAYDNLWKTGLLIKLKRLGINGNIFNYIDGFLTNRTIQVRVGDTLSENRIVLQSGTPQRFRDFTAAILNINK